MTEVNFNAAEKESIVAKVKAYFRERLDQEIGGFDAEFLIDFFAEEIGAHYYNSGLHDAQALFASKISDAIYEIGKHVQPP